jgi:hypothetical protein
MGRLAVVRAYSGDLAGIHDWDSLSYVLWDVNIV